VYKGDLMDKIIITKHKNIVILKIKVLDKETNNILKTIQNKFTTMTTSYNPYTRTVTNVVDKKFYISHDNSLTYVFLDNSLFDIISAITYSYPRLKYSVVNTKHKLHTQDVIDIKLIGMELYDYQKQYVNLIVHSKTNTVLVALQTGGGKTIIAYKVMEKLKKRILLLVPGSLIERWVSDITEKTNIKKEEVYVIAGSPSLIKLIKIFKKREVDKYPKVIVTSTRTMHSYYKRIDNVVDEATCKFGCNPQDLLAMFRTDTIISDETHMEFNLIYMTMIRLNPAFFYGMSATMDSSNDTVNRLHRIAFPSDSRIEGLVKIDKYIDVIAVQYVMVDHIGIDLSLCSAQGTYSHHRLEGRYTRYHKEREFFFRMLCRYI